MSLFQPTQIIPSSFTHTGTIDVNEPLTVSWQVNGKSPMVAYKIDIYENTTTSTLRYTTGRVELPEPFKGTNNLGVVQFFSANPISPSDMAAANIVNGYMNGYKLIITQWWSAVSFIAQTSASYFITRAAPILTIDAFPNPITTKEYSFTATYTQAQGDTLDWVHWYIASDGREDEPLLDTGDIYGTCDLRADYDGFFSGESYKVRCVIQTENGIQADTGWQDFNVSYLSREISGVVNVCKPAGKNYVDVSWTALNAIMGVGIGNYSVADGKATMLSGSSITWDTENGAEMNFPNPWTFVWKGKVANVMDAVWTIYNGDTPLSFVVTTTAITLTYGGATLYTQSITGTPYCWWTTIVTQNGIWIQRLVESGGLYPSETLYPSATLYPRASTTITTANYSGSFTLSQSSITRISVYGAQICEYAWLESGIIPADTISSIMEDQTYEPAWGEYTYFLADFEHGLSAGNMEVAGYSIYRKLSTSDTLVHLTDVDASIQEIWDFGAASQSSYQYYVFVKGETSYLNEPLVSETITPIFWDHVLLETELQEDGAYHVIGVLAFGRNLDTSAMSNNNSPNILINFTRYPTRQPSTANYRSGALNSFVGDVDKVANTYIETPGIVDSIYDISTSINPKFYKNRRGDVIMVETSAAINMQTGDQYREQPQKMSLPWVEVGSAKGVSIIATKNDKVWPDDNIINTTVDINPLTGMLVWTTPTPYTYGSGLYLTELGELVQAYDETFAEAIMEIVDNELRATIQG